VDPCPLRRRRRGPLGGSEAGRRCAATKGRLLHDITRCKDGGERICKVTGENPQRRPGSTLGRVARSALGRQTVDLDTVRYNLLRGVIYRNEARYIRHGCDSHLPYRVGCRFHWLAVGLAGQGMVRMRREGRWRPRSRASPIVRATSTGSRRNWWGREVQCDDADRAGAVMTPPAVIPVRRSRSGTRSVSNGYRIVLVLFSILWYYAGKIVILSTWNQTANQALPL
jgi:hypothetical protein